jgi:DNA-3-methyladenine glycosylase II
MILTQYKYLGDWTVDMLLMFTYYRNDILPMTDYGIRQGLSKLYHVDTIEEDQVNKLKLKLGQHATIFSFCL